jgi:hypothetical protein
MALEAKYAGSDEDEASIGELQRKLDELPYARREAKGR